MSLYAIGDLHLCLGAYKPMDVFGGRWEGYMDKLREGLSVIQSGDTTVLLGDLSWALGIEQAEKDFARCFRSTDSSRFTHSAKRLSPMSSSTACLNSSDESRCSKSCNLPSMAD